MPSTREARNEQKRRYYLDCKDVILMKQKDYRQRPEVKAREHARYLRRKEQSMSHAPEEIHGVSMSQLSIARHYGGCKFNGHSYTYNPVTDVLVRDDVLAARAKAAKASAKKAKALNAEKQTAIVMPEPPHE